MSYRIEIGTGLVALLCLQLLDTSEHDVDRCDGAGREDARSSQDELSAERRLIRAVEEGSRGRDRERAL